MVALGPTLTDVLEAIYNHGPLSLQADYARKETVAVAALASLGFITSLSVQGTPTRQWRLTARGIEVLNTTLYQEFI